MKQGKITELGDRNSGFLKLVGIKEPLFFHADFLEKVSFTELKVGDKMAFDVQETKNGPYALAVHRA